jgi:hypothetical protein
VSIGVDSWTCQFWIQTRNFRPGFGLDSILYLRVEFQYLSVNGLVVVAAEGFDLSPVITGKIFG